jgi:hypothetical protein
LARISQEAMATGAKQRQGRSRRADNHRQTLAQPHCWLTNKTNAPAAINRASRIPATSETTQCRLGLTSLALYVLSRSAASTKEADLGSYLNLEMVPALIFSTSSITKSGTRNHSCGTTGCPKRSLISISRRAGPKTRWSVAAPPRGIPPLFKADSANLTVWASKDGKLRMVYGGWDDAKERSAGRGARTAREFAGGWRGGSYPPLGEALTPLKNEDPPLTPPVSPAIGAAQVHRTVHFSPSFLRSRYA